MGLLDKLLHFISGEHTTIETKNLSTSNNKRPADNRPQITPITKVRSSVVETTNQQKKQSSKKEDYKIAAMLNCCRGGRRIGQTDSDYPKYLLYEYDIRNPIVYHKKLIDAGYLVEAPLEISLNRAKVSELKAILRNMSLSDKGKKDELIQRIKDNANLENLSFEKLYLPSEKGIKHLEKYSYVFAVQNYSITVQQYESYAQKYPNTTKQNDIIWRILDDQYNRYYTKRDFGLARNVLLSRAKLLISEKKLSEALFYLICVLHFDVSGLSNNGYIDSKDLVEIAPGIVSLIYQYKDVFHENMLVKCYEIYHLPHSYLTKDEFRALLYDIFDGTTIDKKKYF